MIAPFVTIGLRAGDLAGPTIERDVSIGTGAKIIGPVRIGDGARIGANAVVVDDVPAGATVAGVPAARCSSAVGYRAGHAAAQAQEQQGTAVGRPEPRGAHRRED